MRCDMMRCDAVRCDATRGEARQTRNANSLPLLLSSPSSTPLLQKKARNLLKYASLLAPLVVATGSAKKAEDDAAKNAASTSTMVKSTINWSAPEILTSGASAVFAEPSDVYSFACTVFEVITLGVPWTGVQAYIIQRRVVDGERPSLKSIKLAGDGAQDLRKIVQDCWQHDAGARPEMEKVLRKLEKLRAAHPVSRKQSLAAAAKAEELEELRRKFAEFEKMQKRMKEMKEENSRLRAASGGAGARVLQGSAKAAAKEEREEKPAVSGGGGGGGGRGPPPPPAPPPPGLPPAASGRKAPKPPRAKAAAKEEREEKKVVSGGVGGGGRGPAPPPPPSSASDKPPPVNNLKIPDSEFRALVDIYERCGGKKWKKGSGWGSSTSSWTGVSVKDGHVVKLHVESFGLTGGKPSVPKDLSRLACTPSHRSRVVSEILPALPNQYAVSHN